uniref:F-box domain-containing protein n=1 Tax=Kalanchoe fedtschenkoi TaxID=63787 RepID=A0A7N0RFS2_KALFE
MLLFLLSCISLVFTIKLITPSSFIPSLQWRSMLYMKLSSKLGMKMETQQTHSSSIAKDVGTLLDLPDPILDAILERLPPAGLRRMAAVSTFLREKCISDHLWDRHMKWKWGRIIGPAAYQEWRWHVAFRNGSLHLQQPTGLMHHLLRLLKHLWFGSRMNDTATLKLPSHLPDDSIFSWYLALESGTFWFPAQIYNRQNGHVGFLLSCYDAKLCYDHQTDTFQARYPAHGMLDIPVEKDVTWDRLRAAPVETPPCDLFTSYCLNELHPGDHIEIQWRRNKEFPYGWWYGVVGHLDACDVNEANCLCGSSDTVVLEFKQYASDSRWRRTLINRREHTEKGDEVYGFYGGIRKLRSSQEISKWRRLWPPHVLEGV